MKIKKYFCGFYIKNINNCVNKSVFSEELKHSDITPVHKKKDENDKTNFRPVSVSTLTNVSKTY